MNALSLFALARGHVRVRGWGVSFARFLTQAAAVVALLLAVGSAQAGVTGSCTATCQLGGTITFTLTATGGNVGQLRLLNGSNCAFPPSAGSQWTQVISGVDGTYTVICTPPNIGAGSVDLKWYDLGFNIQTTVGTLTFNVTGPPAPTPGFTQSLTSGVAPLSVTFTNTSSGSPTSYAWDFGDGGTSTATNPTHTFAVGTRTVTLTATNATGSASVSHTVTATAPPTPIASFDFSPTEGDKDLLVAFTNTSSGSPTSYAWNFGDGGTSTAQSPTHTYTSRGTFTISMTATNGQGSDTVSHSITVAVVPPHPPNYTTAGAVMLSEITRMVAGSIIGKILFWGMFLGGCVLVIMILRKLSRAGGVSGGASSSRSQVARRKR